MANEKRLVRPQYNLKSERDLRKLLDDAGLPTSGDREKLVERHRQWINIWNANLDSTKARRSAAQLRKDLAAWERTKTSAKDHSAHVDRQKTTWVKTNKSQFDDLIQKAKMGASKDKKLRDAAGSEADSAQQPTTIHGTHEGQNPNSESQPHVITSSPALPEAGTDLMAAVRSDS
uniref:SAP domain-containing protein n=2 Tax=Kalmanozyma brasiliensis (strain GHG001) TaxID=1365824 RepID=V5F067_KALBG